jgi:tetratricopeptide (TPR) repeat protein
MKKSEEYSISIKWKYMKMSFFTKVKITFCSFFFGFVLLPGFGQSSFSKGEVLFIQNQPQEALEFLEAAITEDPANVEAFLYLGITYQQLDRIADAIEVYQRILPQGGPETARIAFNLGNAYLNKGDPSSAVQSYTEALAADPSYSTALLNRANAQVQIGSQESLKEAVEDYQNYLDMEVQSSQAGQITRLVNAIQEDFAARERSRLEKIAAEEQLRMATEAASRQESERRQRFLEGVISSLQAAAEDPGNLSAGNEELQDK